MLAPPCSDPAVFEQEKSRAGGNWEAYFAKHPDLRGIPGLRFPGPPDAPVSPAGWNCFGLFFDGVTVPSDENKLKIAENVRDWFQLLYFWIGLFPPSYPINMDLLLSFGADYAERYNKEHRVCCSEDTVIVMSPRNAVKDEIELLEDEVGSLIEELRAEKTLRQHVEAGLKLCQEIVDKLWGRLRGFENMELQRLGVQFQYQSDELMLFLESYGMLPI